MKGTTGPPLSSAVFRRRTTQRRLADQSFSRCCGRLLLSDFDRISNADQVLACALQGMKFSMHCKWVKSLASKGLTALRIPGLNFQFDYLNFSFSRDSAPADLHALKANFLSGSICQ